MKTLAYLLLLPCLMWANEKEIPLKTKKVTVFLAGAQITADAQAKLMEGNNVLLFSDLSPNIDQNSIQVKGLTKVSLNSIKYNITFLKQQKLADEVVQLEGKIEKLKDKIALKNNAIYALETEESLLTKNKTLPSSESSTSLAKLKEYAKYYRERSEAINNQIYELKKERDAFQKEMNRLQQEVSSLNSKNRASRGEIKLFLNSEISQNTKIEISYLVADASWSPSYELRAKNTDSPVDFLYQAKVEQNTGDDWNEVEVSLSTADPSTSNQKPILRPYYLGFVAIPPPPSPSVNDLEERVVIRGMSSVNHSQSGKAQTYAVQKSEQLTVMNFKLPKKYSIQSGDEPIKVKLDQQDIQADYEYYSAPLLDSKVYLTATLKDWESLDLLPGEASIYFEDTYAGRVFIDANKYTEDFVVSLGSDQNIVVERKQVNKMKSKSFFRNNSIVEKEYEISLRNNKNIAVEVKLEDRIPISQDSAIKLSDKTYEGASLNKETGILTWKVQLDSKARQTHKFAYKVSYPKDQRINLER